MQYKNECNEESNQNPALKEEKQDPKATKNESYSGEKSDFEEESVQVCQEIGTDGHDLQKNGKINDLSAENVQISTILEDEYFANSYNHDIKSDSVSEFNDTNGSKKLDIYSGFFIDQEQKRAFERLFPGISVEKALNDPDFKVFAEAKGKSGDFCEIYTSYASFVKKIANEAVFRAKLAQNNKQASPGALNSVESNNNGYFTKEQVKKMTKDQIAKNYNIIRQSQQKW